MDTVDEIAVQVATSLKDGVYAATSVEKLSGGTANFVFRANLVKPLEDGSQTVVVKHTEGFVALTPTFKLPVNRCVRPNLIYIVSLTRFHHLRKHTLRSSSRAFSPPWMRFLHPPTTTSLSSLPSSIIFL